MTARSFLIKTSKASNGLWRACGNSTAGPISGVLKTYECEAKEYILPPGMDETPQLTLKELLERMRKSGSVPLGTIAYNFNTDQLEFSLFKDVDPGEVNALLHRVGIRIKFSG